MTKLDNTNYRLNPKSILVCNLALRECGKEVLNDAKSLMNHFVKEHGWKKIPELPQRDIDQMKKHPKTGKVMTKETYLEFIDKHPEEWWLDNELWWVDIRNLHFLHKRGDELRSLRRYYRD